MLIEFKPKDSILTCLVTHNRLDLTKITIDSYCENFYATPHFLVVVDNASGPEVRDYLSGEPRINHVIFNEENKYPGAACNQGWEEGLKLFPDANLLHRSDNDIFYRKKWDMYAVEAFRVFPELGLLGLIELSDYYFFSTVPQILEERGDVTINKHMHDIGGSYILRRSLWDQGIRHVEESWSPGRNNQEDHILTQDVYDSGFLAAHTHDYLVCHLGSIYPSNPNHPDFEYYNKTITERGGFEVMTKHMELEKNRDKPV